MAFTDIPTIEKFDFYIGLAFRRAQKVSQKFPKREIMKKFDVIREDLSKSLNRILLKYPNIDDLDPFYNKLFKANLDYVSIKKALGSLVWCDRKVAEFHKMYIKKIAFQNHDDKKRLNKIRIEFYGRINSCLKQIKKELATLEESRRIIKEFPVFKTNSKTICLVGFPNVGKTTLLYKLTGSKADIKPYAFTTKGINVSYSGKLQILDTPGTLNRPDKMNAIEYTAYLAMEELADFLIYVFDPTESYDLNEQIKLYKRVKKYNKKVYVYVSKRDICDNFEKELSEFNPLTFDELKALIKEAEPEPEKKTKKPKIA